MKEHYIDERLIQYIEYDKRKRTSGELSCIYCGCVADDREHIPPKIFLDTPYPERLNTVPSCRKCNQFFSKDEEFFSAWIEYGLSLITGSDMNRQKTIKTFSHSVSLKNLVENYFNQKLNKNEYEKCRERIEQIAKKLVIGHCISDLGILNQDTDITVFYNWVSNIDNDSRQVFNEEEIDDLLPEIGSKIFVDYIICTRKSAPVYRWKILQEGNYRYISTPSLTRIVIREAFYIEATY